MIPYYMAHASAHAALIHGFLIAATSLLTTALFLVLSVTCRAERYLYTLTLPLLLPCTGLSTALPLLWYSAMTPFLQGVLLLPLLLFPASLPVRTLQTGWAETAQELGAGRMSRLRLFWWPLLQKPACLSIFLSLVFSIVQ
ncbi:spermidine/putrescine ABC transporter permease [Acetobacter sp. LMG 32666]|uniref:spermidine/putrescine ABC transporter permease n=1 Tax=Acetobacter sp. LMG 32666 TaxID=2959295 RepID=UPI0030C81EF2